MIRVPEQFRNLTELRRPISDAHNNMTLPSVQNRPEIFPDQLVCILTVGAVNWNRVIQFHKRDP